MRSRLTTATVAASIVSLATLYSQVPADKTTYVVATAHLDSQWNWTVQDTIRDFVPRTFYTNFEFFEKYPNYVFNWEGAIHYMWFKEYYPDDWARVQKYVADGRWRVSGSWINAVDVNMPSPESLFRQALYGQRFFREEFNKVSRDIYLPDCFGFPWSLPAIARASGLSSFSTQKLTWGRPIPFPVGRWKGVDGNEILANLDPKSYTSRITGDTDITTDASWTNQFTPLGDGKSVAFRYVGTGDTGGAPTEETVQNLSEGDDEGQCAGEGAQHFGRPAGEGSDAAAVREASRAQRRADSEDPRHRLLHVAGGDEEVQPRERTARRCSRAVRGRGAVADRNGVSGRAAPRVVGARPLASVPR